MRDKNLSFIQFSEQVEKFISKKLNSIEILRSAVIDSPTFLSEDFMIKTSSNKLQDLRGLAIISYFVPEILGWKLRGILDEKLKHYSLKDQKKLKLLLSDKERCLAFLYETQEFSSHEIFGNLLTSGVNSLRNLRIIEKVYILKKPQRKRGYDDKGTLRSPDRWLPAYDYTLTDLQNELNKDQDLHERTITYLEQYLQARVKFYSNK